MTIRAFIRGITLVGLLLTALAGHSTASPVTAQAYEPCILSSLGEVPAYADPQRTEVATTLLHGDGGQVMGQLKDGTYGVALGLYAVETIPVGAMSWVDYSANIALKGSCDDLPLITFGCGIGFSAPTNGYRQPNAALAVAATFDSTDNNAQIKVVGQQADGWYAIPDPAAPANVVGTLSLLWVKAGRDIAIGGDCLHLPTFYPAPKLDGDICTVRTDASGESYPQPSATVTSGITPLPTSRVQILALALPDWYGYDPATAQDGAAGAARLRWVNISKGNVEIKGDCAQVPLITTDSQRLEAKDSGSAFTTAVGNSIVITLPSDIRPGAGWSQTADSPAKDNVVVEQQGQPHLFNSTDGLGTYTFTFQAVGAGTTTIDLEYTSLYGQPTDAFEHTFTIEVTVEPARTLESLSLNPIG